MHSYCTENSLKKHERICINHDYCETTMPELNKNILKSKSNEKSINMPHVVYAGPEIILKKLQSCQPNLENSYTEKKNVHIARSYALLMKRTYNEDLITFF